MREEEQKKYSKEKENDKKKETENIKKQNNTTQGPPLNPQEFQPAPSPNQQPADQLLD